MAAERTTPAGSSGDGAGDGKVNLRYLGFCGADDSCDPELLAAISARHPYVEWGVLFRPDREGQPRYASPEWVQRLAKVRRGCPAMNLAGHLCGSRVPQVLAGDASFVEELYAKGFRRVQVNATAINGVDTSKLKECVAGLRASMAAVPGVEWIVQRNDETRPLWEGLLEDPPSNMSLLFDASCGTGVLAETFPAPHPTVPCGYAGGMGPGNIADVLPRVAAASGGRATWVDMESRLRAQLDGRDVFCVDKCFKCAMNARGLFIARDYDRDRAKAFREALSKRARLQRGKCPAAPVRVAPVRVAPRSAPTSSMALSFVAGAALAAGLVMLAVGKRT